MDSKCEPKNLFPEAYNYDHQFENEELTYEEEYADLSDMLPLEGDEEIKEGKILKILTPTNY